MRKYPFYTLFPAPSWFPSRCRWLEQFADSVNSCGSTDIKATAILKLIYLEMFGHDMSWASFHVLEVMASTKFLQKRIGYLAAIQSFTLDTDILMLATNLLKKARTPLSTTYQAYLT